MADDFDKMLAEMKDTLAEMHRERDEIARGLEQEYNFRFNWHQDINAQMTAFSAGFKAGKKKGK